MSSYKNWYRPSITVTDTQTEFAMEFNLSAPTKLMPFIEACDYTAKILYQEHKSLYLSLSGGQDSECVADVLIRNQIPFTPIIADIDNTRDHYYALDWCKSHDINPTIIHIDQNDQDFLAHCVILKKKYRVRIAGNMITSYLSNIVKNQGGVLVTGDPAIVGLTDSFYTPAGDMFDTNWFEFLPDIFNGNVCEFFFYTPELALSYATYIDTSLSYCKAKSELYQVPYRPKYFPPPTPISKDMAIKLEHRLHPLSALPVVSSNNIWHKNDLISILENKNV